MSGHSHFATIRRQKESKDAAKGKIFSRHAKAILIAVKAGGNTNPDMNARLRFAIDQAKADNMPKSNIDRLLARASESGSIDEVVYEGFGPGGIMIIVESATDNRNRTVQEIKNLFEKNGGNMGGPGSVSFNFDPKGLLIVRRESNIDEQMLNLIDAGADDILEAPDALEVYVTPDRLSDMKKIIEDRGYSVLSMELVRRAKTHQTVQDTAVAQKVLHFLDAIENQEDVQKVFTNLEIPESVLNTLDN